MCVLVVLLPCLPVCIEDCCVGKPYNQYAILTPITWAASLGLLDRKQTVSAATFVAAALCWPSAAAPSADVLLYA